MMPRMARSVVVLPAPLRPSSVTVSPLCMARSTPCSTWLSPYQALRPFTSSSGSVVIARPHIGFAHAGVGADVRVAAFGQDLAPLQHGDAVAQIGHHRKV